GVAEVPGAADAMVRDKGAGGQRAAGVDVREDPADDGAQRGQVCGEARAVPSSGALENGVVFYGNDAGGVGPVFEQPAASEESPERPGQIAPETRRQHEVLVSLHHRHGVDLNALKVADLPQDGGE